MIRARVLPWSCLWALLLSSVPRPVASQACEGSRLVELRYTPTERAQVAVWLETPDGTFVETLALTEAVALRGIGNRPGGQQMVSGFRYPYGRRESALPVWAHRRAAAPGAELFPRVIFQDRAEGHASRTVPDSTYDSYFCLSFMLSSDQAARDSLDGVTCPSMRDSNIDKGRYITASDVEATYFEPFESGGMTQERPLSLGSLYPPRRDVVELGALDRPDVAHYDADALAVMPSLDAVTAATPVGGSPQSILFSVPADWPDGDYVAFIEVNVEGDYNGTFDDTTYPGPSDLTYWDTWAIDYGYPYIGQPSVVYSVPFNLGSAPDVESTVTPSGYGDVYGQDAMLNPMDGKITNDPTGAPGSGADRLDVQDDGSRFYVQTFPSNLCADPAANTTCQQACINDAGCPDNYRCGSDSLCEGLCDDCTVMPGAPIDMAVDTYPDPAESHQFAQLRFTVPTSARSFRYQVRVSRSPILTEADFQAAELAKQATIAAEALEIPTTDPAGTVLEVDIGGLAFQTRYYVAMRTIDACNYKSPFVTDDVETTDINFTTVTPCFVATAAYGSPLAAEVGVLRRFRDRHLLAQPLGRPLVDAYYSLGPAAARWIAGHDSVRVAVRVALTPVVALLGGLLGADPETP